jgi:hypothetical protein
MLELGAPFRGVRRSSFSVSRERCRLNRTRPKTASGAVGVAVRFGRDHVQFDPVLRLTDAGVLAAILRLNATILDRHLLLQVFDKRRDPEHKRDNDQNPCQPNPTRHPTHRVGHHLGLLHATGVVDSPTLAHRATNACKVTLTQQPCSHRQKFLFPKDCALSLPLNCSGSTPIPARLLRWMRSKLWR